MIIDVWGPKFVKINGKKEISFFEIKKTQNMINLKKTGWIVRYICDRCKDNKVCTTTSHVFFNEKYIYNTLDSQICKSCRSRISEYEIKKSFIPYEKFKLYINEYKYFLLTKKEEYDLANNKSQFKLKVICENGHNLMTTWNNWSRGKRCRKCYENDKFSNSVKHKDGWDLYKFMVWKTTEMNYKKHKKEININNNERGINYHLDHKYSISEGFKNNILPSIVGGKENLRIISSYENMSKGSKCSIKLSELIIK